MIEKAHAKVNIFLKMVGTRGVYHELLSRFMRVENLYDTLSFEKKSQPNNNFELLGNFGCPLEKNSIYKAYLLLLAHTNATKMKTFFQEYKVIVNKKIPEFAGLGGGSSDAAAFLRLSNRILSLNISSETLATLSASIGADVPFFIYDYPSANVSGIGEIVTPFEEETLNIETDTPPILCDTAKVYQQFRKAYLGNIDGDLANSMLNQKSLTLLKDNTTEKLNDLFFPACDIYPALREYHDNASFFSGSGSTFFRINHG